MKTLNPKILILGVTASGKSTLAFELSKSLNAEIISVRKINKKIPVTEYLKAQKRFRHLFESERGREELKKLQAIADRNIKKYDLIRLKLIAQDAAGNSPKGRQDDSR